MDSQAQILGESIGIRKILALIEKISLLDSSILITGESGTGKELVAHAIHTKSPRRQKPFVVVNCAAIPETLLEAELFGFEKGAFTGALENKEGKFETANGGTLFLDEIGCLSTALQSKLLRFLQDNIIERIGGKKSFRLGIRVIAATNLELGAALKSGQFRADLYYRLNVIRLHLPPLRERKEDIPHFIEHFTARYAAAFNKSVKGFSRSALRFLLRHDWPGNVRELKNLVERCVALAENAEFIRPKDLHFEKITHNSLKKGLKAALAEFEKDYLRRALSETGGNQAQAAIKLGLHRTTLISKLLKYGIK